MKTKLLIALVIAMVAMCCAMDWKQAANRNAYAEANNCEWTSTGTAYGDDRDFVCK